MKTEILDLFEWIGRKLLRALARGGVALLLRIMKAGVRRIRKKVRRYSKRFCRLRGRKAEQRVKRRLKYQEWRLANWRKALRWVESKRSEITDRIAQEVHEAAGHIPEIGDTIARWEAA